MKPPDLKSTLVAAGIGGALFYLILPEENFFTGAIFGATIQILVRIMGVS